MKVLIADKFEQSGVARLRELGADVTVDPDLKDDALRDAMARTGCKVLIVRSTRVTEAMFAGAPELAMVIRAGSGFDTIDTAAAAAKGVRVCNCPGMNSVAVAELTLGMMIALDRRIVDQSVDLRRGVWNKKEYGKARGLKGRTLGVVGLGRIGYAVAKRAAAFDMKLIYADEFAMPEREKELGIAKVSFGELLKEADFITLHVPGGAGTKHLIGQDELASMKSTAFLINCSRGGIIDQSALADAVKAGTVGGAALDVFENEPGAADKEFSDPVVQVDHIYGTHHVGASTDQAQSAVADEAVRIVSGFMKSGEFLNCVN